MLGDLVRTVARGDWSAAGIFWLCVLTLLAGLVVVMPVASRRRGGRLADVEGALFAGSAQLIAKPVRPPDSVAKALAGVHKTLVFGRSQLDADRIGGFLLVFPAELRWVPGKIAGERGATAWSVNWEGVERFEIGRTPLAVRSWNADVGFVGGGSVSMLVTDPNGLRAALRRTPLAGSDRS